MGLGQSNDYFIGLNFIYITEFIPLITFICVRISSSFRTTPAPKSTETSANTSVPPSVGHSQQAPNTVKIALKAVRDLSHN